MTFSINIEHVTCFKCGISFGIPESLLKTLRDTPSQSFWCPNGHCQCFIEPKSDRLQRLVNERDVQLLNTRQRRDELQKDLNEAREEKWRLHRLYYALRKKLRGVK